MGHIIDLTTLFPWRILILFAYSFAYYNIIHSVLKDKIHPLATFGSIFLLRTILSIILFDNIKLNALGFPLFLILSFIIIYFITEGKVITKIIASVFYFLSYFSTSALLSIVMGIIFNGKDYQEIFGNENPNLDYLYLFLIKMVCFVSISFLFSGLLKLFAARKSKQSKKKLYAYFTFFPLSHIMTVIIALFLATNGDGAQESADFGLAVNVLVYLLMGIILVFDCSFPFVSDYFEKMEYQYDENKKELVKSQLKYQQTQLVKEEIQEIHKIKHDFLNITATAKSFIENKNYEKAIAILSKTNDDLSMSSAFYICSNPTLNTILYIKQKQAKQIGVSLSIDINEKDSLYIDDYSICRVMHNLIDNAIEAAANTEQKLVNIMIKIDENKFSFECQNYCNKNSKNKKLREGHGYGIGIIKEIVKQNNGKYYANQDDNLYYIKIDMENKLNSQN